MNIKFTFNYENIINIKVVIVIICCCIIIYSLTRIFACSLMSKNKFNHHEISCYFKISLLVNDILSANVVNKFIGT